MNMLELATNIKSKKDLIHKIGIPLEKDASRLFKELTTHSILHSIPGEISVSDSTGPAYGEGEDIETMF